MQSRFRGRLTFELDIEPATLTALVPRFVLQPLVENAIKHGVEPREEGGRVIVTARRHDGSVRLGVRDNGDGLVGVVREGTGVRNTRERLHHLYGADRQQFTLTPAVGGGTIASLTIPFETDDEPAASYTTPSVEVAEPGVRRASGPAAPGVARAASGAAAPAALGPPVS
jgi:LytS/YehU family sensor histidine kinase